MGTFTPLTITPKWLGVNLIKIQFGAAHSDGSCMGDRMSYHRELYDREKASATLNIMTYSALISTASNDALT